VSTLHQFGLVLSLALGLAAASPAMVEAVCSGSTLPTLAANMVAGEWCQLATTNNTGNSDIFGVPGGCYITEFQDGVSWDPKNNLMHVIGQSHACNGTGRHVVYKRSTNEWVTDTWPYGCQNNCSPAHTYDFNSTDPVTGDHYWRHYGVDKFIARGQSATGLNMTWTTTPTIPTGKPTNGFPAIKWFPELSGAVLADSDMGVFLYKPSTNAWTMLANTSWGGPAPVTLFGNGSGGGACSQSTASAMAYSAVRKVLLFFPGTCATSWKLDQNGTWTQMADSPAGSISSNGTANLTTDPVSGDFIVLKNGTTTMWRLNPTGTGTWSTVSQTMPAAIQSLNGAADGMVSASNMTDGVIVYPKYTGSSTQMWLFKLSPSSPNQPAPAPPIGLNTR
jgi:hypothetical protein